MENDLDLDYPFCEEFILSTDSAEHEGQKKEHCSDLGTLFDKNPLRETKSSNTITIFESTAKTFSQRSPDSHHNLRPCDVMVSFNPDEDEEVLSLLIKVTDSLNPDLFDEMVSYFGF